MPVPSQLKFPIAQNRRIFSITSWGHAGGTWITEALNAHPRIHAEYSTRSTFDEKYGPLDGYQFTVIAANLHPASDVNGHVICLHPHEFRNLKSIYGERFYGCFLMGHPILRMAGSLAISTAAGRYWKHADFLKLWDLKPEDELARQSLALCGAEGDHVAVNYITHVNRMPLYVDKACIVRFDRLWTSDEAWHEFVMTISGGLITDYGNRWRTFEGQFIDPYGGDGVRPFGKTPLQVWQEFPERTRQETAALLTDETREFHAAFGYDLSFIPRHGDNAVMRPPLARSAG